MSDRSDLADACNVPTRPASRISSVGSTAGDHLKTSKAYTPASSRQTHGRIASLSQQSSASMSPNSGTRTYAFRATQPIPSPLYINSTITRGRGLSRSSSVPSFTHHLTSARISDKQSSGDETNSAKSAGTDNNSGTVAPTRHDSSSVKHLTCFWWKDKGTCRFSDDDCLYAHYDTGHYTDPPRQLIPGEPALAGRKLDRAMRSLAIAAQRPPSSLASTPGSRHGSRPSTPIVHSDTGPDSSLSYTSPISSPVVVMPHYSTDLDLARLSSDNQFLRTLVDQNGKEKAMMISTIERLETDNNGMKGELEGLRKAQEQLLVEREGLHKRINQMEGSKMQSLGSPRSLSNPFGAIGRGRVNTETRYLGGLLTEE